MTAIKWLALLVLAAVPAGDDDATVIRQLRSNSNAARFAE